MKLLFLLFISLFFKSTLYCQTKEFNEIQAQWIWNMGHDISEEGEVNYLALYPENIKPLPENIKAIIVAIAVYAPVDIQDKNKLAEILGYLTLEEANQELSKKWIVDKENIDSYLFFEGMSFIHLDSKIFFFSEGSDTDVLVFEESPNGKISFVEKYDSSEMNRIEAPNELQARLNYEATFPATYDDGVIINGLKWATRNVGTPNTFVMYPEDFGMYYQFNRKIGWNQYSKEEWKNSISIVIAWQKANDPCPAGWRVPNAEDLKSLIDTTVVDYIWMKQNGINGMKFTDKYTKKSIFLPFAGYRESKNGSLRKGEGYYWSKQPSEAQDTDCTDSPECVYMHYLYMTSLSRAYLSRNSPDFGFVVRCVSE